MTNSGLVFLPRARNVRLREELVVLDGDMMLNLPRSQKIQPCPAFLHDLARSASGRQAVPARLEGEVCPRQ